MSDEIILIEEDDKGWLNPSPGRWENGTFGGIGTGGLTGGTLTLYRRRLNFIPRNITIRATLIPTHSILKTVITQIRGRKSIKIEHTLFSGNSLKVMKRMRKNTIYFLVREPETWLTKLTSLGPEALEKEKEKNFKETGFRETDDEKNIREEREIEEKRVNELVDETISKGGLENYQRAIDIYGEDPQYFGGFENTGKLILEVKAKIANEYEISLDYNKAIKAYKDVGLQDEVIRVTRLMGDDSVKHLDYDKAIEIYESIGDKEAAMNARKLKAEQGAVKVTQKVVHGDEVTKTEIKDSVLNRSNVGGKSSKAEEIKEIKELLDSGAIDKDDYEKMKREIIG